MKDTLDAFSRLWREWLRKLWVPYIVLAATTGVFVALLLMACTTTFFPLVEWWRLTADWTLAMELTQTDVVCTTLAVVAFVALFPASWYAHRAMARVVETYDNRPFVGRRRALAVMKAAAVMAVTLVVMWMPLLTLFLSAHATALSEVWDDAVETPATVWIAAFVLSTAAMFVCEWAMTLCRLAFKKIPDETARCLDNSNPRKLDNSNHRSL